MLVVEVQKNSPKKKMYLGKVKLAGIKFGVALGLAWGKRHCWCGRGLLVLCRARGYSSSTLTLHKDGHSLAACETT